MRSATFGDVSHRRRVELNRYLHAILCAVAPAPTPVSQPLLTKAMIYQIGNRARSPDVEISPSLVEQPSVGGATVDDSAVADDDEEERVKMIVILSQLRRWTRRRYKECIMRNRRS
uniref:Uncharacterized protein n=1 Tax=Solanum tuberosum TaxID=4113 RepID=M1DL19_SOLTU